MRRIAHISDLHFGKEDAAVVAGLQKDILDSKADLVIVSGDLSQRARRSEFKAAKAFLDSLQVPAVAVPGNHDIPLGFRRFVSPFRQYQEGVSPDLTPAFADPEVAAFGLNTVLPLVWKGGLVRGHQLQALQAWARSTGDRLRVVFAHHPFSRPEWAGHSLVRGWADAIRVMEESSIDLVLTGHHHVAGHSESRAFAAGGPHRLIVVRAGTAISRRVRGTPNSYNLIHVDDTLISVEERQWQDDAFHGAKVQGYPRRTQ